MLRLFKYFWLKSHGDKILPYLWAVFLAALCLLMTCELFSVFQDKRYSKEVSYNLEAIGQGPFSLNPQYLNPHTPKVLETFFVIQGSKKMFGNAFLHLGSVDSNELKSLSFSEFLKLDIIKNDQGREVSWFLKPVKVEKDVAIFEARQGTKEPMMVSLPIINICHTKQEAVNAFMKSPAAIALSKAQVAGQDCLYIDEHIDRAVIAIDRGHFISLAVDDAIYFVNGKWQTAQSLHCPIAELKKDGSDFFFHVTHEQGFINYSFKLSKSKEENFSFLSLLPSDVKIHESNLISCRIGHQRLILKKGDWIVKSNHICQILRSKISIEKLIKFEKYGPLVVIDDLEIGKERSLVRGKIFSPLRIKAHPFEIEAPVIKITKSLPKPRAKGVKKESL